MGRCSRMIRTSLALVVLGALLAASLAATSAAPLGSQPGGQPSAQRGGLGTVAGWGSNSAGQATVPSGLQHVVAIAGGLSHSLALRADGTVAGWGSNTVGQATVPRGLTN